MKLRVCQISKADAFGGGASRVAEELTAVLRDAGHEAVHLASWSGKPYGDVRRPLYGGLSKRIREGHLFQKKLGLPEFLPLELPILLTRHAVQDFDVLHFHDLSSAISPLTLMALARTKPVVWTLHDCSPFTGGCLYPMGCTRFRTGCGSCPQLGEWPLDTKVDLTRFLYATKAKLHASGVHCVTPSSWMADTAMSSGILPRRPEVISNGVDTRLYRALDKQEVRTSLGIPTDRRTVLLSAGQLSDPRKGAGYAVAALQAVKALDPFVVLLGSADEGFLGALEGLDYHAAGYVSDPSTLSRYYACADLMLYCSLADNQPLTLLEALASGTPVVGFKTGGVPEIVPQDECGWLVPPHHGEALANAIRFAFEGDRLRRWSLAARQRAETLYSHERFLAAHVDLYDRLLRERTPSVSTGPRT